MMIELSPGSLCLNPGQDHIGRCQLSGSENLHREISFINCLLNQLHLLKSLIGVILILDEALKLKVFEPGRLKL